MGGLSPREPAGPCRGSVELLLGGELIEVVALSLESELLSSLGHRGGTHEAVMAWPGAMETGSLGRGTAPSRGLLPTSL